jgi:hypothetical protein
VIESPLMSVDGPSPKLALAVGLSGQWARPDVVSSRR